MEAALKRLRDLQEQMARLKAEADRLLQEGERLMRDAEEQAAPPKPARRPKPRQRT